MNHLLLIITKCSGPALPSPRGCVWLAGTDLHTFADVIAHASYDPATGATTITHDGSDAIVLLGVGPNSLSAAEFIFT